MSFNSQSISPSQASTSSTTKKVKRKATLQRKDSLPEKYVNDPTPPLIRYYKEGPVLRNKLKDLEQEYKIRKFSESEYKERVRYIYKSIKPRDISRQLVFVFKTDLTARTLTYGVCIFRRDHINEIISKNIKNTALARYYDSPTIVALPQGYETWKSSQKLAFLRNHLHKSKIDQKNDKCIPTDEAKSN